MRIMKNFHGKNDFEEQKNDYEKRKNTLKDVTAFHLYVQFISRKMKKGRKSVGIYRNNDL